MDIKNVKGFGYKSITELKSKKIEEERRPEHNITDGFQLSIPSENHPAFKNLSLIKTEKEIEENQPLSRKEETEETGIMEGPGGTLLQFEDTKKPVGPLREIVPGQNIEEAKKIAEGMICEGGLRAEVKETILRDLTAFPLPILRLLKNDKLDIAVVKEEQSLADTSFLTVIKPEEYQSLAQKGKAVFDEVVTTEAKNTEKEIEEEKKKGNTDEFHLAMIKYWEGDRISETLSNKLIGANLGFTPVKTTDPINIKSLAEKNQVEDKDYKEWVDTLKMINGDHIEIENDMIKPGHGVFITPYTYYKGQPVSETTLKSLKNYDSQKIKNALGIHLWQDRLVILHEDYAADPGKEVGHYRIILHECGHALDHAIERIPGTTGEEHRKTVNEFFRKDMEEFKKTGKNNFISPRAMDSVREYFAEAVESYLTVKIGDEQDHYKADDNHIQLKTLNKELYDYIDKIMRTDFPADLIPAPPEKDPEGVRE